MTVRVEINRIGFYKIYSLNWLNNPYLGTSLLRFFDNMLFERATMDSKKSKARQ
jgi:hypothetical protein